MSYAVLAVNGLTKHFLVGGFGERRPLVAVDNVSFRLEAGRTLAIVGESGSGKSTVARCIVRLTEPTSGSVILCGQELRDLDKRGLAAAYRKVQMVFQDPNSSLNPRMSVRRIIGEPLKLHLKMTAAERDERVRELLQLVQLDEALIDRLPHQLSGGQRQRVGIARALAVHPEVVILDEPTSSLDVSVRGQIVALLEDLQARLGLAYVFISHDLNVVNHLAHDIAVMYLGEVIEMGSTADVFENPVHPYTKALLASAPRPKWAPVSGDSVRLDGEIPSPVDLPPGCRLEGRCPVAESTCAIERPHLEGVDRNHLVACPVMIRASTRTVAESPMVSST